MITLVKTISDFVGKNYDIFDDGRTLLDIISVIETKEELKNLLIDITNKTIDNLLKNKSTKTNILISEVSEFIKNNYKSEITIKSISKCSHMNTAYLGRIFKRIVGISLSDYINKTRIEAAKKMMLTSDMKIYEIADKCGYKDIDYFRNIFKKYTGIGPSEFKYK